MSPFLHILLKLDYLKSFFICASLIDQEIHLCFNLYFFNNERIWACFVCIYWPYYLHFFKVSFLLLICRALPRLYSCLLRLQIFAPFCPLFFNLKASFACICLYSICQVFSFMVSFICLLKKASFTPETIWTVSFISF